MLASAIVLGVLAAFATGGNLSRFAQVRIRFWPLLLVAIGIRVVAGISSLGLLFAASLFGILLVCIANRRLPGVPLIALGTALNFTVVAANNGMPVSAAALAGASATFPLDGLHTEMSSSTLLDWLGDVVPLPLVRGVYSFGDLASAAGAFWLPVGWARR